MPQYTVRRLLSALPVLVGILVVTFLLARLIPGDPCHAQLGEKATPEACERFERANGLDKPIVVQFAIYAGKVLQGDFGESIRFSRPVALILAERLPMTIELSLAALTLAILVGIPAGIIASIRHNSGADVATMMGANVGVSVPVFVLGLTLAYVFALLLKDTPFALPPSARLSAGVSAVPFYEVYGWTFDEGTGTHYFLEFFANLYIFNSIITGDWKVLADVGRHLILPAIALATIPMAIIARMTRSSLLDILGQDYVRAAKAKGVPRQTVVMKHAFRNALLPVVTIIGLSLGALLGGAVLTETVFGLAGVGRILFEAITARDYPIIQAFTLVIAVGYVVINLLVDLSYTYLDPRIRLK
ncbi:MAG: dppB [Anaerolineales bacterium]|jgi:peptide/nickel transport system permease protein|nr:dppB [Anaerolineales bacterium]